jgi:hypothetical protein
MLKVLANHLVMMTRACLLLKPVAEDRLTVIEDGRHRSEEMKPLTCACCCKALTSALWDKKTEQWYCAQCVPPLPPSGPPQPDRWQREEPGATHEGRRAGDKEVLNDPA